MQKKMRRRVISLLLTLMMVSSLSAGIMPLAAEEQPIGQTGDWESAKLIIGFIYIGTDSASSGTHSFVEIHNPNDFEVNLTDTYALHYKSMAPSGASYVTPDWIKLNLVGEIPAHHSFLVNLGATGSLPGGAGAEVGRLDLRDKQFDQDFVWSDGIQGYNKGVKFVLTSNQEQLPSDLMNPFDGDGTGQIDGYVDMYGVSGNDNTAPSVDGYETDRIPANDSEAQSKQKGFVRLNKDTGIKYQDTDNNRLDFQQVDFRSSNLNDPCLIPRSLEDGAWEESATEITFAAEALTLQPGTDATAMNFNWYSDRDAETNASAVQVAKKSAMTGGEFPAADAILAEGTVGDAAPGKSWHKVFVTGLDNDTIYVYRVSNDKNIYSEIYEFKTGPEGSFRFVAVGDPQLTTGMQDSDSIWPDPVQTTREGWIDTMNKISQYAADAAFIAGTGDQVDTAANEDQYTNYFAPEQLRSLPVAPAVGNHEGTAPNFGWHFNVSNETDYGSKTDAYGNYWYAYNNALFVVLNTAPYPANAEAAAPYIEIMDATLQAATAANPGYQWLIVQHHKTTASPASHQTDADVLVWAPLFNELMDQYRVDFVLAGHDHVYSRSWFIKDNQKVESVDYNANTVTNPEGTLYISLTTASGLKYYDFPVNAPAAPAWMSDTANMYTERKSGPNNINGKPWYTNIGIQIKAPQFTTVDVTDNSVTFKTYRTDTMAVIDEYTIIKTNETVPFEAEALTLTPGTDAAAMNFNWYSDRDAETNVSTVQVAKKSAMTGGEFPAAGAVTVNGTRGDATDGKSWHKAGVSGLEPDTAYVYRVSNDGVNFSIVYEFKTGADNVFTFAVVGDPQLTTGNQDSTSSYRPDGAVGTTKQGWQDTLSVIAGKGVDFIAGVGDQVDASLTTNEAEYANFFGPAELRGLPFSPAVGNHDRHDGFAYHYNLPNELSFETLTGPSYGNPSAPQAEAEARGNYYYTYNNALFVVLNTSSYPTSAEAAAAVVARFDATLGEATQTYAGQFDWLFVQHHKSTASVADHIADRDIQYYVEAGFEKLMDKYGVDFVLAGHDHVYARSYPMLDGAPDKTGASGEPNVTLIMGGDGADAAVNPKGTVYFTTTTGSGLKYYELFNNAGNLYVKDNIYYPFLVNGLVGSAEYMNGNLPLSNAKYLQNKTPGFILVTVDGDEVNFAYYDLSDEYLETPYDTYTVTKTWVQKPAETTVNILHTNDIHGRFYQVDGNNAGMIGIDKIAAIKNNIGNAILADAGDTIHGLPIVNMNNGLNAIELMTAAGYDVATPGNHDYNYGSDRLLELAGIASMGGLDYISANTIITATGDSFLPATKIIEVDGVKVGFFGLTTQATPVVTDPVNVSTLTFGEYKQNAAYTIGQLRDEGADVIVALAHVSHEDILGLISALDVKPDVVIEGHDHLLGNVTVDGVLIAGAGQYMENLGVISVTVDATGKVIEKTASIITKADAADVNGDAGVKALAEEMKVRVLEKYSEIVAKSEVFLSSARGDAATRGVRNSEQPLGNLVADAMRVLGDADITVTNGGGLRADIQIGDITRGDLNSILPFGNVLVVKEATPAALKAIMENGLQFAPSPDGRFPQISGMSVVYDPAKPAGLKVLSIAVNGIELDLTDDATIIRLATNDFMANGGDGYTAIAELTTIAEIDSLDTVFERYIVSHLSGTITEEHAKLEGRILALGDTEKKPQPEEDDDQNNNNNNGTGGQNQPAGGPGSQSAAPGASAAPSASSEIPDAQVPMTANPAAAPANQGNYEIVDEETPLGNLPKTGTTADLIVGLSGAYLLFSFAAANGILLMNRRKKR